MYIFIFESIGTSELILVGLVALIFLGPRKMPQMARKIGKIMAEFRGTANEFKATWEREVNFEEEAKLLNVTDLEGETIARGEQPPSENEGREPASPEIKEVDSSAVEQLKQRTAATDATHRPATTDLNDKQNWL